MSGYFSLSRTLLNDPLWLTSVFSPAQAFIDLVGLAQWKDSYIRIAGQKVEIKRGQCGWSEVNLAQRWKWSRGKVRRFLDEISSTGKIIQQTNTRTSIITICNYDNYCHSGNDDDLEMVHQTEQQTVHQTEQQTVHIRRKENKENKEKNTNPTLFGDAPPEVVKQDVDYFPQAWDLWPKKEGKKEAQKAWKTAITKEKPEAIIAALQRYREAYDEDRRDEKQKYQYTPRFSTWLNGERWNDLPPPDDDDDRPDMDFTGMDKTEKAEAILRLAGIGY